MSKLTGWWSGGVDKVFGFDRQNKSEEGRCSLYRGRSSAPASTAPLLRAQINACIPYWERKLGLRDSLEYSGTTRWVDRNPISQSTLLCQEQKKWYTQKAQRRKDREGPPISYSRDHGFQYSDSSSTKRAPNEAVASLYSGTSSRI
jgi:hypothetical protein